MDCHRGTSWGDSAARTADWKRKVTDDLDGLKRSVDMVALLTQYGVTLAKKGNEYHGLCIWHDETKPSMQVYVDKKDGLTRAHCKSCGRGGTVIDVVMEMDCCDEAQAIAKLKVNGFHRDDTRIKADALRPIGTRGIGSFLALTDDHASIGPRN